MAATTELLEAYGQFWSLALGFAAPLAIKAAIELDLFNIISKASSEVPEGPTLDEIASKLHAEAPRPQNLFRLLKFLVLKNVLRLSTVNTSSGSTQARYGLTKVSELLVSDNDYCTAPMLQLVTSEAVQLGWHHISDVVTRRTGNCFYIAHGKQPWDYAAEHPEFNNIFNDAMRSTNKITFAAFMRSYDGFNSVNKLVDVGGGTGLFIADIVKAYPHIQGFNFDLPHVVAHSPAYPGVESIPGNALESIPSADAILMKTLLHSHTDVDAAKILENCHKALQPQGKLIICEMVLEDTEECVLFDMLMLAGTDGIERSEQQWRSLLTSTGFGGVRIFNTSTPHSIIEAIKQ